MLLTFINLKNLAQENNVWEEEAKCIFQQRHEDREGGTQVLFSLSIMETGRTGYGQEVKPGLALILVE